MNAEERALLSPQVLLINIKNNLHIHINVSFQVRCESHDSRIERACHAKHFMGDIQIYECEQRTSSVPNGLSISTPISSKPSSW